MEAAAASEDAKKQTHMASSVEVYDLAAKYQDSMLDGRVPGGDLKVKYNGGGSLDRVEVTVVFYNADGNAITEEDYNAVLVSEYSFNDSKLPVWILSKLRFEQERSAWPETVNRTVTANKSRGNARGKHWDAR